MGRKDSPTITARFGGGSMSSCAYKSNDDRIGAMNIYRKGIELISQSDPAVAVEQVSIAKGEVNRPKGVISLDIPTPQ